MKLLLDTHIWLWAELEPQKLGKRVQAKLRDASSEVWLSPISVWEFLLLAERGRIAVQGEPEKWVEAAFGRSPLREAQLSNAVALASRMADFRGAVAGLEHVWANFRVEQVFRADTVSMLRAGLHWLLSFISSGLLLPPPRSLLDNTPLRHLLARTLSFRGVRRSIDQGRLLALGISATGFSSGRSIAFFDGATHIAEWERVASCGQRTHDRHSWKAAFSSSRRWSALDIGPDSRPADGRRSPHLGGVSAYREIFL